MNDTPVSEASSGEIKDCRKCRDYRGCKGKPWFHYGEIRFCPFQILWIIEHSETLRANWPPDPDGSTHIDPNVRAGYKSEGYYTKPAGILGEVNTRLARTGIHGKLLRAEVLAGLDLSSESKDALMYIKGWRRKRMGYNQWKKWRKLYQKVK